MRDEVVSEVYMIRHSTTDMIAARSIMRQGNQSQAMATTFRVRPSSCSLTRGICSSAKIRLVVDRDNSVVTLALCKYKC